MPCESLSVAVDEDEPRSVLSERFSDGGAQPGRGALVRGNGLPRIVQREIGIADALLRVGRGALSSIVHLMTDVPEQLEVPGPCGHQHQDEPGHHEPERVYA